MKIAVVVSTFPPYKGGMGNVAQAHAEALRRAGHEVTVLAPDNGLLPMFVVGNASVVPQLAWRLRAFDAVELHYPFYGGAEWVLLWKRLFGERTRLVTLYHMDSVGTGWLGRVFAFYREIFLHQVTAVSDRVIVTSKDYFASSQAAKLIDTSKVVEVPLAVDATRFSPAPTAPHVPTALFVGGLDSAHYFKGVYVLLQAFAEASKKHPNARLEIIGDGDLRASYESEAKRLGISERVAFLGKVADEQLPAAYRNATFHVLPSIDRSEAFGLVTLEAAASGIPSIVSDLPGVRSVVVPGETGLVVPTANVSALAEAMSKLFADAHLAAQMGVAARKRVEAKYASDVVDRLIVKAVVE